MHMNEKGVTLQFGKHKGRLLRPARHYGEANDRKFWPTHYTTAVYSDDNGKTWTPSKPFADKGTGEAALAELSDGTIYYNSRCHWNGDKPPKRRRCAWSDDGGETWRDWQIVDVLPDGPQDTTYGTFGGLVRLPIKGRDILLYSNCDSEKGRQRGTVWASFDGGKTWPLKRLAQKGGFGYSALAAGRPGTPSEGQIYLFYAGWPKGGGFMVRFNLSWLLQGEKTGDGEIPNWVAASGSSKAAHLLELVTVCGNRTPLAAFISYDEGVSFAKVVILDVKGKVMYPDAELAEGGYTLHLHYESRKEVYYANFDVRKILDPPRGYQRK